MADNSKKLGLFGLVAIVFSSMIGGGIFTISQNMAAGAGLGATMISWLITAVGIMFLVLTFKALADSRPDLNAGIYQYAQKGYGNYVGFNIAWGYWLSVAMGNVAYAVMLNDSFGYFFPTLLEHGWPTVLFGSVFIWLMFFIIVFGVKAAAALNTIVTVVKFASLALIIILLVMFFKLDMFNYDFWGKMGDIGGLGTQIKSTMLVTLWCFIGIEGAVVISARAKNSRDVGKAGVIGFLMTLVLYALISILSYGIMDQQTMAKLKDPSVGYLLETVVGHWGVIYVALSVIVSLVGSWIAWTILLAQVPYMAAQVKILPKIFDKVNKQDSPVFSLLISSLFMQLFMIMVVTAKSVYMAAIDMTGVMILPPYLFSGLYLFQAARRGELNLKNKKVIATYMFLGIVTALYCLWLIYAGGLKLIMITSILYLIGIFFFIKARHENMQKGEKVFSGAEKVIAAGLIILSIISVVLIIQGKAGL